MVTDLAAAAPVPPKMTLRRKKGQRRYLRLTRTKIFLSSGDVVGDSINEEGNFGMAREGAEAVGREVKR